MITWTLVTAVAAGLAIGLAIRFGSASRRMRTLLEERGGVARRDGHDVVRRGVTIHVGAADVGHDEPFGTGAAAHVRVPSGLRFLRLRQWDLRGIPPMVEPLVDAAVIADDDEGVTRSDRFDAMPFVEGLAEAWGVLTRAGHVLLGCDGRAVAVYLDKPATTASILDALLDVVAAVARWDDGFAALLAALPGAEPLVDRDLAPAVTLPGGVVLGVRDATVVAELDAAQGSATATVAGGKVTVDGELPIACSAVLARAGSGRLAVTANGARFSWATIERDPARHRAAVEALRALAAQGPYR